MARPGFFAWREWRHGIGRYKGKKPRDPKLRPHGLPKRIPLAWWVHDFVLEHGHRPKPTPKPVPAQNITMYDSITIGAIPKDAEAVAGYVGGYWPTYKRLVVLFPKAHKLSIAIKASENADCLDIEPGDAVPADAAAWIKRQHARGKKRPVVYTSLAFAQSLVSRLAAAGLQHGRDYKLWSAHYTQRPHICSPKCGLGLKITADATQWSSTALGRNLDISLCSPTFFEA